MGSIGCGKENEWTFNRRLVLKTVIPLPQIQLNIESRSV
jgi:hypothetical protein